MGSGVEHACCVFAGWASALGVAFGGLEVEANLGGFAFCALAGEGGGVARARAGGARDPGVRGDELRGRGAVSDEWRDASAAARSALDVGISGDQRAALRRA